jgi:hypothetical protein
MEIAVGMGLDVTVVSLPPGVDPADAPEGFEDRLASAEPYALYRVRIEIDRAADHEAAYGNVKQILDALPESPQRQEAWRLANDRLGMTIKIRRTVASEAAGTVSPALLASGDRLERDALAGTIAHPQLVRHLAELSRDHFDSELHRRLASVLAGKVADDADTVALRAELDARAAHEGIDEDTAKELLLRLRERHLQRELQTADFERVPELQTALARIRHAVSGLS